MRVGDSRKCVGADDQDTPGVPRPDKVICLNQALKPTGAAKRNIVGDRPGVIDLQELFDPGAERRNAIRSPVALFDVAEIMGYDNVVQCFFVNVCREKRFFAGIESNVGGDLVVGYIPSFLNSCNFPELANDFFIRSFKSLSIRLVKSMIKKIVIGNFSRRNIAPASNDDGVTRSIHGESLNETEPIANQSSTLFL